VDHAVDVVDVIPLGNAIVEVARVTIGTEQRVMLRANCGQVLLTHEQSKRVEQALAEARQAEET
jgi:translation initiation factor 2B subunit (eIF-2B alpha/beta/delta family)